MIQKIGNACLPSDCFHLSAATRLTEVHITNRNFKLAAYRNSSPRMCGEFYCPSQKSSAIVQYMCCLNGASRCERDPSVAPRQPKPKLYKSLAHGTLAGGPDGLRQHVNQLVAAWWREVRTAGKQVFSSHSGYLNGPLSYYLISDPLALVLYYTTSWPSSYLSSSEIRFATH